MKTIMPFIILAGVSAILPTSLASAAVPVVESVGQAAIARCPVNDPITRVYHSDKIVFMIGGVLQASDPVDQPALDALPRNTELDVKVRDNPARVAHIPFKVLTFLGAAPTPDNVANIRITDVEYTAVVCPGVQPM